ncbi:ATP synthase F1, epsilon subunit [Puccinia sorghi]|uniref:ATP synthase subunit delta, mitochondrial n=1 Tax=Puccinia sorghi TaxID=27349 RepID=A0A0L6V5U7_9BASI|nr:ATP synthase F1, epsilon subunit [Puccinia sorghi]
MFGFRRAVTTSSSRAVCAALPRSATQSVRLIPSVPHLPARKCYATEASGTSSSDGKLQLSLVLPHETIYQSSGVTQVNIAAESGDMGVLANHVASIESLKPGVVEVIEGQGDSKKWFVSGGFANVHPNNLLTINAVEAYPLDAFSAEAARSALQEAQRGLTTGSEAQKAEAAIEVEVFECLLAALK